MGGSFGPKAMQGVAKCMGNKPWLRGSTSDDCNETPRTLQRGSSNVWFASVRSAISIPPWSEGVHKVIGKYWPVVSAIPVDAIEATLTAMGLPQEAGLPVMDLLAAILEMRGETASEAPTDSDLRREEYQALVVGRPETSPRQQFVCAPVDGLDEAALSVLQGVSEVARLREVRALEGFTRVKPTGEEGEASRLAPVSLEELDWLPAIEVLGEGVFLRVREDALAAWEHEDFAVGRALAINDALKARAEQYDGPPLAGVSARQLLLHSFAHVLLTELSLDAGYPVASLRERVYSAPEQTGILVYTASADSAGSLGGLSAQSDPDRIWAVVQSAIRRARWCSSDPVCIESSGSGSDALNLAACHACLLLPETSCERMNHVLDRACLVGLPSWPELGFFSRFVK